MKIPKLLIALLLVFFTTYAWAEKRDWRLSTNLIGLGFLNLNIEGSVNINSNWTIQLPINYSSYSFNPINLYNFTITPGVRYYYKGTEFTKEERGKWFSGAHLYYSLIPDNGKLAGYNVGCFWGMNSRFEGWGIGAGISGGYTYKFNKHWLAECELGVGLAYMDYSKFECGQCGKEIYHKNGLRLIPTKIGLNIVYQF